MNWYQLDEHERREMRAYNWLTPAEKFALMKAQTAETESFLEQQKDKTYEQIQRAQT